MAYTQLATSSAPALIIYLLDISASMGKVLGPCRRLDLAVQGLWAAIQQMVFRSTKGIQVSPRYRVAIFPYHDDVYDLLGGVKTVDEVARMGFPQLPLGTTTNTARAFEMAERVLKSELPRLRKAPAPLVCHMTDGEYDGDDPQPIARRIMSMEVEDGKVLVENIFISHEILADPIQDANRWRGINWDTPLQTDYARKLRTISSPIPRSYLETMRESSFSLGNDALMLIPGTTPELVSLGFVMSSSTPTAR